MQDTRVNAETNPSRALACTQAVRCQYREGQSFALYCTYRLNACALSRPGLAATPPSRSMSYCVRATTDGFAAVNKLNCVPADLDPG